MRPLRKRTLVPPDPGFAINILEPYKGIRISVNTTVRTAEWSKVKSAIVWLYNFDVPPQLTDIATFKNSLYVKRKKRR